MAYIILKNPTEGDGNYGVNFSTEEIKLNTILDELKLDAFLERMGNKSLEEIETFFKK